MDLSISSLSRQLAESREEYRKLHQRVAALEKHAETSTNKEVHNEAQSIDFKLQETITEVEELKNQLTKTNNYVNGEILKMNSKMQSQTTESVIDQSKQTKTVSKKKSEEKLYQKIDLLKGNIERLEERVVENAQALHMSLLEERIGQLERINIDSDSSDSSEADSSDSVHKRPKGKDDDFKKIKKDIKKLRLSIKAVNENALKRDEMQLFYEQIKDFNMLDRINRTERNMKKLNKKIHKLRERNGSPSESSFDAEHIGKIDKKLIKNKVEIKLIKERLDTTEEVRMKEIERKLDKVLDEFEKLKVADDALRREITKIKESLSSSSDTKFEKEFRSSTVTAIKTSSLALKSHQINGKLQEGDLATLEYLAKELHLAQREIEDVKSFILSSGIGQNNNERKEYVEGNNQNDILKEIEDAKRRLSLLESGSIPKPGEVPKLFVDLPPSVLGHIQLVFRNQ